MAKIVRNYPGDRQRVAVAGLSSDDLITFGGMPAVALTDTDADGFATLQFKGIVDVAVASGAVTVGQLIYLDGGALTTTPGGVPWGVAIEARASGATAIAVKMLSGAAGVAGGAGAAGVGADDVEITIGAEAADVITVGLQFKRGTEDAGAVVYDAWLSAAADGQTVKAAATSLAAGTDGTILVETVANAVWKGVSEADGDADIAIGDAAGADTYYLNVVLPNGVRRVSDVITFAA